MKKYISLLALIPLFAFGGCYTQLALRSDYGYNDDYTYEEQEDTSYVEKRGEVNIYNYYYDGPYYRRYYWGYYPGWSITIGTYYYDPFWWDFYYPYYYPWWYYPYHYNYWVYTDYWYYPHYWHHGYYSPGVYKYRNTYTRLRNTDGGRSVDIRDRGSNYRSGRTSIGNQNNNSEDVDLSRTGVSRNRDNNSGTLPKGSPGTTVERKRDRNETRINYPVDATRDRGSRERTGGSERSRGSDSERSRVNKDRDNSSNSSQPSYSPPPSESRAPAPSYNPPPRSSSGGQSTRGGDGGRSGGDSGRRR